LELEICETEKKTKKKRREIMSGVRNYEKPVLHWIRFGGRFEAITEGGEHTYTFVDEYLPKEKSFIRVSCPKERNYTITTSNALPLDVWERAQTQIEAKLASMRDSFLAIKRGAVIDGEIVRLGEMGADRPGDSARRIEQTIKWDYNMKLGATGIILNEDNTLIVKNRNGVVLACPLEAYPDALHAKVMRAKRFGYWLK